MPDLIPIPGFSPEDIKRKARSALLKLKDNYHLVSLTEASHEHDAPEKKNNIVSSFIKHISELHTVEASADKWNSQLMAMSFTRNLSDHCFTGKDLGYSIKGKFYNGLEQVAELIETVQIHGVCYEEFDRKICPMEELEKTVLHEQQMLLVQHGIAQGLALRAGITARIQHYDRELDSADHGENAGVKTAG